jgi:hypothetical protein
MTIDDDDACQFIFGAKVGQAGLWYVLQATPTSPH